MTRAELLAKIRKCLALAKSANEHEAAAALSKARELMDAYGLDQADIDQLDVEEATSTAGCRAKPPRWEAFLVGAVTRALPCKVILSRTGRRFIGMAPTPEIAAYAFGVLHRHLRRARADYIATRLRRCTARKTARADAFCEGWAAAVYGKIADLHPERNLDGLVLDYLARRYPALTTVKPRAAKIGGRIAEDDFNRGWDAGDRVQLHHGVAGSAPVPQLT